MDDRLRFDRQRSRTTRHGPCGVPGVRRSCSRCRRASSVVGDAVSQGPACSLASKGDGFACDLHANHLRSVTCGYALLQSVDAVWQGNASREVASVHHRGVVIGNAACHAVDRARDRPDASTLFRPETATHFCDSPPSPLGAYQFLFAASFRISMSSACSATIFFSRAFSFSKALNCFVMSGCIPPYF